jgi:hypothetical protein
MTSQSRNRRIIDETQQVRGYCMLDLVDRDLSSILNLEYIETYIDIDRLDR